MIDWIIQTNKKGIYKFKKCLTIYLPSSGLFFLIDTKSPYPEIIKNTPVAKYPIFCSNIPAGNGKLRPYFDDKN